MLGASHAPTRQRPLHTSGRCRDVLRRTDHLRCYRGSGRHSKMPAAYRIAEKHCRLRASLRSTAHRPEIQWIPPIVRTVIVVGAPVIFRTSRQRRTGSRTRGRSTERDRWTAAQMLDTVKVGPMLVHIEHGARIGWRFSTARTAELDLPATAPSVAATSYTRDGIRGRLHSASRLTMNRRSKAEAWRKLPTGAV